MAVAGTRVLALVFLLLCAFVAERFAAPPVWADDAGLIANLAALSTAKGSRREFLPEICASLGLPAAICGKTASCRELNERGPDGTAHLFTRCSGGSGNEVYALIGVYDRTSGYVFWSRPDATMQSAIRLEINPSGTRYVPLQPTDQVAEARFLDEISYWRAHRDPTTLAPGH